MLPVEQLYALQRIDTRLATLRRALDALDPGKSLEALLEQVRSAEEVTATQLRETQARLRDPELSLSSTPGKAKKPEGGPGGGDRPGVDAALRASARTQRWPRRGAGPQPWDLRGLPREDPRPALRRPAGNRRPAHV